MHYNFKKHAILNLYITCFFTIPFQITTHYFMNKKINSMNNKLDIISSKLD